VRRTAAWPLAARLARPYRRRLDPGRHGPAGAGLLRQQVRAGAGPAPLKAAQALFALTTIAWGSNMPPHATPVLAHSRRTLHGILARHPAAADPRRDVGAHGGRAGSARA